jgi:biotin carboxylase
VPLPCVVKPPDRQGQRGLSFVERRRDLERAIEHAVAESRSGTALIEELVDGPEVTVQGFSVGGRFHPLLVTDRITAEPPAFGVALAHVWPPRRADGAAELAARAAEAVGVRDGPTYAQIRIGDDGPRLVELAARLGGGHDAQLCLAAVGVDLDGLALKAALGDAIDRRELVPHPRVGGACTRFLVAPPGELVSVEGTEEAEAVEGVLRVRVYRRPGQTIGELRSGADRAGAILAVGESREQGLERSARAADSVRFEVAHAGAPVEAGHAA